jgi:hypothetical protein
MAAVAATYLVGYGGSVSVDATSLPVGDWNGTHSVGTFDATNALTSGAAFPERTIESLNGSFNLFLLAAGTKPAFSVGNVYPVTLFYKATKGYSFNALITGINPSCDIKGGVTLSVQFASQGAITVA